MGFEIVEGECIHRPLSVDAVVGMAVCVKLAEADAVAAGILHYNLFGDGDFSAKGEGVFFEMAGFVEAVVASGDAAVCNVQYGPGRCAEHNGRFFLAGTEQLEVAVPKRPLLCAGPALQAYLLSPFRPLRNTDVNSVEHPEKIVCTKLIVACSTKLRALVG